MKKLFMLFMLAAAVCAVVCGAFAADFTAFDDALRSGSGTDAEWTETDDGLFELKAGFYTVIRLYTDRNNGIGAMEIISTCALEDDAADTGRELSRTARAAVTALYEAEGLYTDTTAADVNTALKILLAPYSGSGEAEDTVMLAGRPAALTLYVSDAGTVYTLTVGDVPGREPEAAI